MTHDSNHSRGRRSAPDALASAWNALCCLLATYPWLWLARSGRSKHPRPSVWFCSMSCQDYWRRLARGSSAMVDLTDEERAAVSATMKRLALLMDEIGWQTQLAGLSAAQVRAVIEEAVEGFREAVADIAKAKTPEVPF